MCLRDPKKPEAERPKVTLKEVKTHYALIPVSLLTPAVYFHMGPPNHKI